MRKFLIFRPSGFYTFTFVFLLIGFLVIAFTSVATPAEKGVEKKRVAVFPLVDLSGSSSLGWLSSALTEELISDLKLVREFSPLSFEMIQEATRGVTLMHGETPDLKEAEILGKKIEVKWIIAGGFRLNDREIQLILHPIDLEKIQEYEKVEVTGKAEGIPGLIRQLVDGLLKRLNLEVPRRGPLKKKALPLKAYEMEYKAREVYDFDRRSGDVEQAIEYLKQALEADSKFTEAYLFLGMAYDHKGMLEEAIKLYEKVLSLDSDSFDAQLLLGSAYHYKGLYKEAVKAFQKAIALNPNDSEIHSFLGTVYYFEAEIDKAIGEYEKNVAMKPNDARARALLGIILFASGYHEEAIEELQRVIQILPNHPTVYYNLGLAYHYQANLEKAKAQYEKAIELNPNYAQAHYMLAMAYGEEEKEKAMKQWEKYLSIARNLSEEKGRIAIAESYVRRLKGETP